MVVCLYCYDAGFYIIVHLISLGFELVADQTVILKVQLWTVFS